MCSFFLPFDDFALSLEQTINVQKDIVLLKDSSDGALAIRKR
jgi:hypothetical protein